MPIPLRFALEVLDESPVPPSKVLLLGRLSAGLATESKFLAILLGPPELWRAGSSSGAAATAAGGGGGHNASRASAWRSGGGALGRSLPAGGAPSLRLQSVVVAIHSTAISAFK